MIYSHKMSTHKEPIIELQDVDVCFYVRKQGHVSLKEFLFKPQFAHLLHKEFVLKNLNLKIYPGESIGLLGINGCGKSTLLRVLSGIIEPEKGSVIVRGKVAPLLGLGVGLEMELTGRENIQLSCALMGLSKSKTKQVMNAIIDFSELGDKIDWAVKRYSTGMMSRLFFSIAIMNQPEILLVDEVLSVGDKGFQIKCIKKVKELQASGTTLVFVSHSLEEVINVCSKAAFIHQGTIQAYGDAKKVGEQYMNLFNSH